MLPLVAFVAVLPLILRGCSCGHDFDFHIISWFEAAHQFMHGTLHPHWAVTPAWNAGEPRFVFYPPLSWSLGALLGLILPWTWTPIVYTWIALLAAGFSMHYAVRSLVPANAALIASAIYLANPYMLYTAYERSAYGELLAAAWMPLLLHGILRDRLTVIGVAIPIALLWLTNAPAAVMGCYAVAFLALLRLLLPSPTRTVSRPAFAATSIAGALLGFGLASFYIIPAAYERRFVQIAFAILPGLRPRENFLFHHTKDIDHDGVLHTASVLALVLIATTAIALAVAFVQSRRTAARMSLPSELAGHIRRTLVVLSILAVAVLFLLTPLSLPVWNILPQLRFLQFPWRLMAILAVVFGFALAIALTQLRRAAVTISLVGAALLAVSADQVFRQRCYPEDTLPTRLAVFRSANPGSDPTDEYTPVGADNDALSPNNPGYWIAATSSASPPKELPPAPAPRHLELSSPTPATLVLNLRDYPMWRITRNGSLIPERLHRDDGLIAVPLPPGPSHIEVSYAILRDQQAGYLVSSLSLLVLTLLLLRPRKRRDAGHWDDDGVRILRPFH